MRIKFFVFLLAAVTACALFAGCGDGVSDKADETAVGFVKAVLARDISALDSLTHPDHLGDVVYGEAFFEKLEKLGIDSGDPLDAVTAVSKRVSKDDALGGEVYVCEYVARIDQMPYDLSIMYLDTGKAFGVIGAEVDLCTDPQYYYGDYSE